MNSNTSSKSTNFNMTTYQYVIHSVKVNEIKEDLYHLPET